MKTYTYTVLIEHDENGGVIASVPALPGCLSWGRTYEEAFANAREAIEAYLASLRRDGETVPKNQAMRSSAGSR